MAGAAPPSRPTGGAARMGIDLRRRIRPTLKYTLYICATEVKIDRHKLSFLFATWDWTSLWRRRARSSGVGRHGRRHRLDDVRRVQRVPVHANESPRRGRRSESARRRHYPRCRAGKGRHSFGVVCQKREEFKEASREGERHEFAKGSTDFILTRGGQGGPAGGPAEGGGGGLVPTCLSPSLPSCGGCSACSQQSEKWGHSLRELNFPPSASERGEKED